MTLIPRSDRQKEIIDTKRHRILAWLHDETYATTDIIKDLLGLQRNAAYKTLRAMERDNLVFSHKFGNRIGAPSVWGLTPHGAGMAMTLEDDSIPYFEPGKISEQMLQHQLLLQYVRLKAMACGATGWISSRALRREAKEGGLNIVPDAIAMFHDKQVAIEVERTLKTAQRYKNILTNHLVSVRDKRWQEIHYICPSSDMAQRVKRLLLQHKTISVGGRLVAIERRHAEVFTFASYEEWGP